jgi:hypothetical protein
MSEKAIVLRDVEFDPDAVHFHFTCGRELEWLLWDNRILSIYCSEGIRPDPALLGAAFVLAFAPLGWTFQAEIVSSLGIPARALESFAEVGEVLRQHYKWPRHDPFRGVRVAETWKFPRHHRGLMFSGGVDSAMALLELRDQVDWLIHVSNFENLDSRISERHRIAALENTRAAATERGLGWMHLWTNLASVFKHNRFDEKFPPECSFWLGLQHVNHIASALVVIRPLLANIWLAGGFSELHAWAGSCAASSKFVNRYSFPAPLVLCHERQTRQWKIEQLLDRDNELLRNLRVCYSGGNGTCPDCRKCQGTALMIVSAGGLLRNTSFPAAVVPNLIARVNELKELPAAGHGFFNEALTGRALQGSRGERWKQLLGLLQSQL